MRADNPEVYKMTGNDVDIFVVSGKQSGEEYNVRLPIKEIVQHPNINPTIREIILLVFFPS